MSKTEKRNLALAALIYAATLIYSFVVNFPDRAMNTRFNMTFVAILCPLIVPVLFKLFKWKPISEIYIINLIFCYFASLIGSCLGGYSVPFFDKVVHFGFGFCGIEIAYLLYMILKRSSKLDSIQEWHIFLVFVNAVNTAIAVYWEFYEYAMLIFFNNDAINHYTSGVHDTITDMLVCVAGGLVVTGFLISAKRSGKDNFFTRLPQKFYDLNLAHRNG